MDSEAAAQARLRGLVDANLTIVGDLDLRTVLRRIVEAARQLVGAQYAALGVLSPDRSGLEEFLTVGMTQEEIDNVGQLPKGRGVLGALIDDPRAIRLDRLGEDPRAVGFPDGHPAMESFLGVPIRVRDEVFGNLYLTNALTGRFTLDDENLVSSLAATAGVAIHNARLFGESRQRQEWLQASAEVTRTLLTLPEDRAARLLVDTVQPLAGADLVALVSPRAGGTELAVTAAVGGDADRLVGATFPRGGTVSGTVLDSGTPVLVENAADQEPAGPYLPGLLSPGPAMLLPLAGREEVRGILVASRTAGRRPFSEADLAMGAAFAAHASLALEVARGRIDQERMMLLEDRTRIARDLHDHVIQQLFAAGMMVEGVAGGGVDEAGAKTLDKVVDTLDEAIKQIRTSIFQLRPRHRSDAGLRSLVLAVVADVVPALGFEPHVHFDGPVDAASDNELADDVVAIIREGLSNTAKHAHAREATVRVEASDTAMRVVVRDDGIGADPARPRSGLENLRQRAARRSGRLSVSAGPDDRGTTLTCVMPLA